MNTVTKLEPIHVLGIGNVGKFFAHCLAASPLSPPVTLLLHRPGLDGKWEQAGRSIEVVKDGESFRQPGVQVENLYGTKSSPIKNLIVATKTYATLDALRPLESRLNRDSSVLFLQNGMGTMDETLRSIFRTPSARPGILAGVHTHGIYTQDAFSIVHAGSSNTYIGRVPQPGDEPTASDYLLDCLCQAPALFASIVSPQELYHRQLEKVALNAAVNPVTVIFDCRNGHLLESPSLLALLHALIQETSSIIQPLLESTTGSDLSRFRPEALGRTLLAALEKTATNISSMRQDALANRRTEIDYINGYLVARAEEQGIKCDLNRTLVQMVKEQRIIPDTDASTYFDLSS